MTQGTNGASEQPFPTGTVTFMFTDIEGSTEQWQRDQAAMGEALAAHDRTIRAVVADHGGIVFKHTGDGVCAAFSSAPGAVDAAVEVQRQLALTTVLKVRIGIHTGEAELRDGDYFGPTMNRAARVMDAGHGGQVLVSATTASLAPQHEALDLGVYRLKGLADPERIFQVGTDRFPPLRVATERVGNLPSELTSFVGRDAELARVTGELALHRLVTLIGVGGTGKTRLAIEAAHTLAPQYPDGCWLVELAPVTLDESVPVAFAAGLDLTPDTGDVTADLARRLRHKQLLLVVDNCEHLLAAAADVVEELVASCPTVTILVTSREPLMLSGEYLVPVPSLGASDAETLFMERARAESPGLQLDERQHAAVVELCRRVDGLPLAIELAASRVRSYTPVELAAQLDERFRMLVGGRRTRMERHQTMRGTLDWSYDLCTAEERTVFDRLSVFPAGFDMAGARAVAAGDGIDQYDVADIVTNLVDRSLLQRANAADGTTRFRMLETMRAYGREHLMHAGASDEVRARHARHTADTLCDLSMRLFGPDEYRVRQRFEEHLPDASVALDWFIERRDWEQCLRFVPGSRLVAEPESLDLAARLSAACHAEGADPDIVDEVDDLDFAGDEPEDEIDRRAIRLFRSPAPLPVDRLRYLPAGGGFSPELIEALEAGLERAATAPADVRFIALLNLAETLAHVGEHERGEAYLEQADRVAASMRSERANRLLLDARGIAAARRGDLELAARLMTEASALGVMPRRNRSDIRLMWNLLRVRAQAGHTVAGSDVRSAWEVIHHESTPGMQWRAAISAAIIVNRAGHHELAVRLANWVRRTFPGDVQLVYGFELVSLGLADDEPVVVDGALDDLDTLMADALAITDTM